MTTKNKFHHSWITIKHIFLIGSEGIPSGIAIFTGDTYTLDDRKLWRNYVFYHLKLFDGTTDIFVTFIMFTKPTSQHHCPELPKTSGFMHLHDIHRPQTHKQASIECNINELSCMHSKFPSVKSTLLGVHMGTRSSSHMYTKWCWFNTGTFTVFWTVFSEAH